MREYPRASWLLGQYRIVTNSIEPGQDRTLKSEDYPFEQVRMVTHVADYGKSHTLVP